MYNNYQKTESGKISRLRCETILSTILKVGREFENDFIIEKEQEDFYIHIALYFSKSLDCKWDIEKGLLISGHIGTGKTLAMKIMQKIFGGFTIINSRYLVREFLTDGIMVANRYGKESFGQAPQGNLDKKKPKTYCFDDFGLEEVNSKLYGNQSNIMMEVLLDRYDMFLGYEMKTFATTNLTPELIEKNYGERVRDRMREMMNYIVLTGKSKRK